MKTINLTVFSFDELSENVQKKIIERERWNVMEQCWVNPYKPEEERFTLTLTDEERLLIEERIKAGYYSAENIEKRREEAHKAKMLKKRTEICE